MPLTVKTNHLPTDDARGRVELDLTQIPKRGVYDVVVVGGGTGGAPAAIVAGQEGLKTAVIEPQNFLGGIGTGGGIHMYYHGIQTGIQIEIDKRISAWNARIGGKASGFHPEAKKLALQELADEAKVQCFYHTFFVGAVLDGNSIKGVVAENDQGLFWLEARVVIDSTGDADVAAAAGAPFSFGRAGDFAPQPFSLAPGHVAGPDSVSFRNFDAGYVDPTNALDQSRAQLLGRSHLARKNYDAQSRMLYVSPILGLRESRFIDAEYVVTLEDQQRSRRFPDAIARAKAHYDNHAMDYENESTDAQLLIGGYGAWLQQMCHDVPYRCQVPKQIDNLLVACRAAGMSHDAHNLFRMQRDIQALGESAAVAAKVAISSSTTVRKANVSAIQKRLVERNALPEDVLGGNGIGSVLPPADELQKADVPGLLKHFGTQRESQALYELVQRGPAVHTELQNVLRDGTDDQRFLAATVFALQKRTDGVDVLKAAVRNRRADCAHCNRELPRYMGAFFLLDFLGLRETGSIDLALGLLTDAAPSHRKIVSAIRALGRHASKAEGLDAVRAALKVSVDTKLVLQSSMGENGTPIVDDRRFEIELAAASAFAKWGAEDEALALASRYTKDTRALVRNYARRVLAELRQPVNA